MARRATRATTRVLKASIKKLKKKTKKGASAPDLRYGRLYVYRTYSVYSIKTIYIVTIYDIWHIATYYSVDDYAAVDHELEAFIARIETAQAGSSAQSHSIDWKALEMDQFRNFEHVGFRGRDAPVLRVFLGSSQ
jgi:hypothetical protein